MWYCILWNCLFFGIESMSLWYDGVPHHIYKLWYNGELWYPIVPSALTFFSSNLMIIIKGTFRNISNPLKLHGTSLFLTGWLAFNSIYESAEVNSRSTTNACHDHNFHCRELIFYMNVMICSFKICNNSHVENIRKKTMVSLNISLDS